MKAKENEPAEEELMVADKVQVLARNPHRDLKTKPRVPRQSEINQERQKKKKNAAFDLSPEQKRLMLTSLSTEQIEMLTGYHLLTFRKRLGYINERYFDQQKIMGSPTRSS